MRCGREKKNSPGQQKTKAADKAPQSKWHGRLSQWLTTVAMTINAEKQKRRTKRRTPK
jgi:hypothetical protein